MSSSTVQYAAYIVSVTLRRDWRGLVLFDVYEMIVAIKNGSLSCLNKKLHNNSHYHNYY